MSLIQVFGGVSFLIVLSFGNRENVEYTNNWAVQVVGGNNEAERLARKVGFVNKGKILLDFYSFEKKLADQEQQSDVLHTLLSEPSVKWAERQVLKEYSYLSKPTPVFDDPRWPDQKWYMNRPSKEGPSYNVLDVWQNGYIGTGVVVAVVDDGISPKHRELENNYFPEASYDFFDGDSDPSGSSGHGINCAGVVAAVANNNFCGVGIAYNSSLAGIRLFKGKKATDEMEARALSHKKDLIDIYSNSWGPGDKGLEVEGPGYMTREALKDGVLNGRNGRGSIFVFAAGNGGVLAADSCSYDGYVNSIYTIAISGINKDGTVGSYGERCPGIMAVTYSFDHFFPSAPVITADVNNTCIGSFGSSSAAAAMASGLIALVLQANKGLNWRDVQHIIIRSAIPNPQNLKLDGMVTNSANLTASDYLGFGLMDAKRMVEYAKTWKTVPKQRSCTIHGLQINTYIPSDETEVEVSLHDWPKECEDSIIRFLEHVELQVNLNYTRRGDLEMDLVSPSKTRSAMTHYRTVDSAAKRTNLTNWVIMTLHFWGENPEGTWRLRLKNSQPKHQNTGMLFSWTLKLYGTLENPMKNISYVPPSPHTPQTTPADKSSGLTAGEKAGIGVGSVLVILGAGGGGIKIWNNIKDKEKEKEEERKPSRIEQPFASA